MTTTQITRTERESIPRIRHTVRLLEAQSREGKIRWAETPGAHIFTGHLTRGVRDRSGEVLRDDTDPRDGYVLVTTAYGDVLFRFAHLVDLFEDNLVQVVR